MSLLNKKFKFVTLFVLDTSLELFDGKTIIVTKKNKAILYEMLLLDFPRGILTWITDKSQQMFSSGIIVDNTVILSKNPN